MARVLQHGGGVHVEVLAAEHQAGPTSPLRRLWRLGDLHLALAGLAAYHTSFQERLMRDLGVPDQKIPENKLSS